LRKVFVFATIFNQCFGSGYTFRWLLNSRKNFAKLVFSRKRKFSQLFVSFFRKKQKKISRKYLNENFRFNPTLPPWGFHCLTDKFGYCKFHSLLLSAAVPTPRISSPVIFPCLLSPSSPMPVLTDSGVHRYFAQIKRKNNAKSGRISIAVPLSIYPKVAEK
jgi:hypothetical protein